MGFLRVLLPLFLVFLFYTNFATSQKNCPVTRCGDDEREPIIHFPFVLKGGERQSRGYPGFNLSCNKRNETVLDLGSSGKFLVRAIDYVRQEIIIYDQDNCLPKRLRNLNLSDSAFSAYYQYINFYNCSPPLDSSYQIEPIRCLSTSNYSIYATTYPSTIIPNCEFIPSVVVPTQWPAYSFAYPTDISKNLHLIWETPDCRECVVRGGQCGFKNSKSSEVECFNLRKRGLPWAVKYVISIGIGIPTLVCIILIACYICGRFKQSYGHGNSHRNRHSHFDTSSVLPQPAIFVVGLDEAIIKSYPKTVLGESRRLDKPEDNICTICLSEYRAKETLKTIPDCKHFFHSACIDEWLRRNVTCPLCRSPPKPLMPPPPA